MAISSKGEPATFKLPSNIEDGARGFKHTSNPHLGFATASLESGSANIDDSPLQEALGNADVGILHRNCKSEHHKPLLKHL